jgi:hypothetical protein
VTDILAVIAAVRKHPATAGRSLRVAAAGKVAIPALFAAALDNGIEALYLSGALTSFRDLVDSEIYQQSFGNFLPGFLNHTDLPDVAAALAPRRLVLAGAVDARGDTADADAVRRQYGTGNVSIEPVAKWTRERLIAFASE